MKSKLLQKKSYGLNQSDEGLDDQKENAEDSSENLEASRNRTTRQGQRDRESNGKGWRPRSPLNIGGLPPVRGGLAGERSLSTRVAGRD